MEAKMYAQILVPLDGSPLSEQALLHAGEIARCMGSTLHLIRVRLPDLYVADMFDGAPAYTQKTLEADRRASEAYLNGIRARLGGPELPVVTAVLNGAAAEAIIDYARAHHVDLIVMSTHGRSGLSRWVLGSVAEKVLRGAHCPTLIVRGQPAS
jgi:nucleotide-binding universal stress UspA family protein